MAYEDYCRELEEGNTPDLDVFCARFPICKSSLVELVRAHGFLEDHPELWDERFPARWPKAGESILGFILVRELGRGAFARVFLATEPALGGRDVVLKLSVRGAAEARTLGRLAHAHIVPVHSVQEDPVSRLTVVCMPYLGEATLCDVLDRVFVTSRLPRRAGVLLDAAADFARSDTVPRTLAPPESGLRRRSYVDGVLRLGIQLADALAFAHGQGICHGDLKPSNVLLTPDGRAMLLDFNLAFTQQGDGPHRGGTLPYMAPEQLRTLGCGSSAELAPLDARADLFALGVILYELLTGRHPFGPVSLNLQNEQLRQLLLERQQRGPRSLPRAACQGDRRLLQLLERCLAHDPADRPGSASEFASALRAALKPSPRARRWVVRHSRLVVGAALAGVAGVLMGMAALATREPYPLRQFHAGQRAYERGEYENALGSFTRAVASDSDNAEFIFARGRTLEQLGDERLALKDLQKAVPLLADGQSLLHIGYVLTGKGLHPEAIEAYRRALDLGYQSPELFNNLGYCSLQLSRLDEAQNYLDQAVHLDPLSRVALLNRAALDLRRWSNPTLRGIPEAGIQDIRRALEVGSTSPDLSLTAAHLCAVAAWREPKWFLTALTYFRQAIDDGLDPAQLNRDHYLVGLLKRPELRFVSAPLARAVRFPPLLVLPRPESSVLLHFPSRGTAYRETARFVDAPQPGRPAAGAVAARARP
jgi:serine/threonine protein kinase